MKYRTLSSLLRQVGRSGIDELDIDLLTGQIRVKNTHRMPLRAPNLMELPPVTTVAAPSPDLLTIASPQVGIFKYRQPGDNRRPLRVGHSLQEGDIVGYIYAVQSYPPITACSSAMIVQVHIEDGQAVEYDQCLFSLRTTLIIGSDD